MEVTRSELLQTPHSSSHKIPKRKSTRSVSTLTPSQLARKRKNDREAQRAIRARTKEHIERLQKENEDLRSRNMALEDELNGRKQNTLSNLSSAAGGPPPNTCPSCFTPGTDSSAASSAATSPMEIRTTPALERAGHSQVICWPPECDGAETSPSRGYSNAHSSTVTSHVAVDTITSFPAHAGKMEVDDRDQGTLVVPGDPLRVDAPGCGCPLPPHQNIYGEAMPDLNSLPTLPRPSSSADGYTTAGGVPHMTTSMHDSMIPPGADHNNDSLQPQFQQHYYCSANLSYTPPPVPPPHDMSWVAPNMLFAQQRLPV